MNAMVMGIAALILSVIAMSFWMKAIRRVAVPDSRLGYYAAFLLATVLAIAALGNHPGWIGGAAAVFSLIITLLYMGTKAIGRQIAQTDSIKVGALIPEFTAIDEHGDTFSSRSLTGNPVLIKFFRGHW